MVQPQNRYHAPPRISLEIGELGNYGNTKIGVEGGKNSTSDTVAQYPLGMAEFPKDIEKVALLKLQKQAISEYNKANRLGYSISNLNLFNVDVIMECAKCELNGIEEELIEFGELSQNDQDEYRHIYLEQIKSAIDNIKAIAQSFKAIKKINFIYG